ncbi:MAG: ECF transporter S component [Clostridia bacterium]|nr:ECF transporter S component [Clostridia bacterium]
MSVKTKWICVTAVGIAMFVAFSLCLQVPVFENYYLCLGYVVTAVYCYSFGAVSGTLVSCLGVVLYCLLISGLRGMPGWTLGNLVIGILLGLTFRVTKPMKQVPLKAAINAAAIVAATTLGILAMKSMTECLLYAQPFALRAAKNVYAFVADIVVLLVSLPICMTLDKLAGKMFPDLVK